MSADTMLIVIASVLVGAVFGVLAVGLAQRLQGGAR